ncbi:MAG: hypothetical protein DDG60_12600 [Anaerolineae bacterium]|nr:MAG: hypothetical protein DDG60_12600 [Anaerolineae bacterium]
MHTLRTWFKPALAGTLFCFSLAHHLLNLWEWPGIWILTGLAVLYPLCVGAAVFIFGLHARVLATLPRRVLALYVLTALLAGLFITWRTDRIPQSYQSLTITPQVGQIALVEIKNNGIPLPIENTTLATGWQQQDSFFLASAEATPLQFTFQSPAGQPISLLFVTSPQGGTAQVTLNQRNLQVNLFSEQHGQTTLRLTADYRGLPGQAFRLFLLAANLFTFTAIGFLLLILQQIGQKTISPAPLPATVHRRNLLLLSVTGLCVYAFNALTVPLIINPDSHSLLQGSFHFIQHGNLDGVSMYRGPGTTFLFAPLLMLFGNNAWAIKNFLHFLAFACLFPAYRLGWQLSGSANIALLAGCLAVFSPDLMSYASVVMSDVPNVFFVLTFLTLLISALQEIKAKWVFSALLTGAFAVLLRSENISMLAIGIVWLVASTGYAWKQEGQPNHRRLLTLGLAILTATLPILWWSAHNQRVHGFFGMSNYQGEVLYDGWVYYGDALGTPFSNTNSPAIQTLQQAIAAHPIEITDAKGIPTGWEIYPAMLAAGYTPTETFELMAAAARDSILAQPERAIEILFHKYQRGLTPGLQPLPTYPLPGEDGFGQIWYDEYFYQATPNLPAWIALRRQIDAVLRVHYPRLYPGWVLFTLLTLFLSFFRTPWKIWSAYTLITASRILLPLTISVAFWRYTLAGWLPAQITALTCLWVMYYGWRQFISRNDPTIQP